MVIARRLSPFVWLLLGVALIVVLGTAAPGCGMLYWHVKLTKAMSSYKERQDVSSSGVLYEGGSRSIPYFIREVTPAADRRWLYVLTGRLSAQVAGLEEKHTSEVHPYPGLPVIQETDEPKEIEQKCAVIQDWWRRNSGRYPPSWKFWTGSKPYPG